MLLKLRLIILLILAVGSTFSQATIAVGRYAGTGSELSITGMSFSPEAVIVKGKSTTDAYIRTSTMDANESKNMYDATAPETGRIKSLDASGFTVSTNADVNNSGTQYFYVAFNDGGLIDINSFTGDALASQNISGVGFQPEFVWVFPDNNEVVHLRHNESTEDYLMTGANQSDNYINNFQADGFGVNSSANTNTIVYHYMAFDEDNTNVEEGTYAGNGTDDRNVNMGFDNDFTLIMSDNNYDMAWRTDAFPTGESGDFGPTNFVTNRIQADDANGFQVGTDNDVNNGSQNYYYLSIKSAQNLPVDLLNFNAIKHQDNIELIWVTASEINSDHFMVQKSIDGTNYTDIGYLKAAGNSFTKLTYTFNDYNVYEGKTYYRLKQVDIDGTTKIYNAIVVNGSNGDFLMSNSLYPNPTLSNSTFQFTSHIEDEAHIVIRDLNGKIVSEKKHIVSKGANYVNVDLTTASKGMYMLSCTFKNQGSINHKINRK